MIAFAAIIDDRIALDHLGNGLHTRHLMFTHLGIVRVIALLKLDNVIIGNEDTRDRTLNVIFDTYSTIDIPLDEEKCSIKWKIPKDNSMIHTVNFSINNTDEISIPND